MNQSDITNTTNAETVAALESKYLFMLDRVKKLSAAIYAVTDLIKETDPLRQSLRTKSIALLTDTYSLHRNTRSKLSLKEGIKSSLEEMVALIELATFAKFISEMNSLVLIAEYKKILPIISDTDDIHISLSETKMPSLEANPMTDKAILEGSQKKTNIVAPHKMSFMNSAPTKRTFEDKNSYLKAPTEKVRTEQTADPRKYYIEALHTPFTKPENKKEQKNARKEAILKLFQKGLLLTIKDIASQVAGYSEKTVQRELNDLVEKGKLHRVGEKRWSKYTLK